MTAAAAATLHLDWQPLPAPVPACALGESPFWHPDEAALWWLDIPGRAVHRWHAASQQHQHWPLPTEPGALAPRPGGHLLLARRDGLFDFNPTRGQATLLAPPPYDPAHERFNDGKADAQGRFWVGSIFEPRTRAAAGLWCWDGRQLQRHLFEATISNGLAFSPDGLTVYWADTPRHQVMAYTLDRSRGSLSQPRVFAQFPPKDSSKPLAGQPHYQGRPDGAAVDVEGAYWVAMMEGQQLLRYASDGRLLARVPLPVRCPTMPAFGGADGRTLFVTTARDKRPADELAAQPWAGHVLMARAPVAGLPVNFAH